MKRSVTLLLVATLLASGATFAKNDKERFVEKATAKAAHAADVKRDNNQHRGNDRREDRRDHGRDHGRDDRPAHGNDHRGGQRNDHRNDNNHRGNDRRDWNRKDNRGWDRHRSDWAKHPHYWDNRRHDRRDHARYRYSFGSYHRPQGYYHRVWHRGDRLPRGWYAGSYIVHDWHPYRLYSPPYGYHWVRVGNDVMLTALATGIVLDVLYDIWY